MQQQSGENLVNNELLLASAVRYENERAGNELDALLQDQPAADESLVELRGASHADRFNATGDETLRHLAPEALKQIEPAEFEDFDTRKLKNLNLRTLSALDEYRLGAIESSSQKAVQKEYQRFQDACQRRDYLQNDMDFLTHSMQKDAEIIKTSTAEIAAFNKTYAADESAGKRLADSEASIKSAQEKIAELDNRLSALAHIGSGKPDELVGEGMDRTLNSKRIKSDEERAQLAAEYTELRMHLGKQLAAYEKIRDAQASNAEAVKNAKAALKEQTKRGEDDQAAGDEALDACQNELRAEIERSAEALRLRDRRADEAKREAARVRAENAAAREHLNSGLDRDSQTMQEIERDIAAHTEATHGLQTRIDGLSVQMQQALDVYSAAYRQFVRDNPGSSDEEKQAQLIELRKPYDKLKSEKKAAEDEIVRLNSELTDLAERHDQLKPSLAAANQQLFELEKADASVDQKNAEADAEKKLVADLLNELATLDGENAAPASPELQARCAEVFQAYEKLRALREKNDADARKNARLRELAADELQSAQRKAASDAHGLELLRPELEQSLKDYAKERAELLRTRKTAQQDDLVSFKKTDETMKKGLKGKKPATAEQYKTMAERQVALLNAQRQKDEYQNRLKDDAMQLVDVEKDCVNHSGDYALTYEQKRAISLTRKLRRKKADALSADYVQNTLYQTSTDLKETPNAPSGTADVLMRTLLSDIPVHESAPLSSELQRLQRNCQQNGGKNLVDVLHGAESVTQSMHDIGGGALETGAVTDEQLCTLMRFDSPEAAAQELAGQREEFEQGRLDPVPSFADAAKMLGEARDALCDEMQPVREASLRYTQAMENVKSANLEISQSAMILREQQSREDPVSADVAAVVRQRLVEQTAKLADLDAVFRNEEKRWQECVDQRRQLFRNYRLALFYYQENERRLAENDRRMREDAEKREQELREQQAKESKKTDADYTKDFLNRLKKGSKLREEAQRRLDEIARLQQAYGELVRSGANDDGRVKDYLFHGQDLEKLQSQLEEANRTLARYEHVEGRENVDEFEQSRRIAEETRAALDAFPTVSISELRNGIAARQEAFTAFRYKNTPLDVEKGDGDDGELEVAKVQEKVADVHEKVPVPRYVSREEKAYRDREDAPTRQAYYDRWEAYYRETMEKDIRENPDKTEFFRMQYEDVMAQVRRKSMDLHKGD